MPGCVCQCLSVYACVCASVCISLSGYLCHCVTVAVSLDVYVCVCVCFNHLGVLLAVLAHDTQQLFVRQTRDPMVVILVLKHQKMER